MDNLYPTLAGIFCEVFGLSPDALTPDTALSPRTYQELAAAVIACEKAFHIRVEDERAGELTTAAQWAAYIEDRIADSREDRPAPTEKERESWYYQ